MNLTIKGMDLLVKEGIDKVIFDFNYGRSDRCFLMKDKKITRLNQKKIENNKENVFRIYAPTHSYYINEATYYKISCDKTGYYAYIKKIDIKIKAKTLENNEYVAEVTEVLPDITKKYELQSLYIVLSLLKESHYNHTSIINGLEMAASIKKNESILKIVDYLRTLDFLGLCSDYAFPRYVQQYPKIFDLSFVETHMNELIFAALHIAQNSSYGVNNRFPIISTPATLFTDDPTLPFYGVEFSKYIYMEALMVRNKTNNYRYYDYYRNIKAIDDIIDPSDEIFEVLSIGLENQLLKITELKEAVGYINDRCFIDKDDYLDYIKFNNFRPLLEVLEEAPKVIIGNKAKGIKLTNYSQYSFDIAVNQLKDEGYDEEAINLYTEMMEVDPIKALKILQTKKPTKKLKKEFSDELINKFTK